MRYSILRDLSILEAMQISMQLMLKVLQQLLKAVLKQELIEYFSLVILGQISSSAYPVLKAKALAEGSIVSCGVDYTIIRTAVVFGENDHFTIIHKEVDQSHSIIFVLPGDGSTIIQPVWVLDLVTCLVLLCKTILPEINLSRLAGQNILPSGR